MTGDAPERARSSERPPHPTGLLSTTADSLGRDPAEWQGRPVWAEIDLDAIAANVRALSERAGGARLMAIVKANAYGHGAVAVAGAAIEAGATHLGVICVDEGVQLRRSGIGAPIVILGHTPVRQAAEVVAHGLTATVNSRQLALALARFAAEASVRLPVHVKVDTGLSRYGLRPEECIALAGTLRELPSLEVQGLFTHFASADEPDKTFTHEQFRRFRDTAERLPWIPIRHVAASAAILDLPEMSLDMVRAGIALYGYAPGGSAPIGLKPALALKSRIARVIELRAGDTVSYGRTWRAEQPARVGLVMAGYADGLPRLVSNRGSMLLRGRRVPIVGRVCMDQCLVDIEAVPDAVEGDDVTMIGVQGAERLGADDIADLCGTISYEVLAGISARVPRLYLRGGRVVRVQTLVDDASIVPIAMG